MATTVSSRRERTKAAKGRNRRPERRGRPSEEEIRVLAYHLYERRRSNGISGDATSDWIEAEGRLLGG